MSPSPAAKRKGWSQRHDGGHVAIAAAPQRRPIWMLPRPVRLEVVVAAACVEPSSAGAASVAAQSHCQPTGFPLAGFRLEGRMHEIVKAHGPERIETAWWRGPTVRRDYYVVETSDGGRYWIFRRLDGSRRAWAGGLAEAWFLHGMFS